jgi:hypothetical protein
VRFGVVEWEHGYRFSFQLSKRIHDLPVRLLREFFPTIFFDSPEAAKLGTAKQASPAGCSKTVRPGDFLRPLASAVASFNQACFALHPRLSCRAQQRQKNGDRELHQRTGTIYLQQSGAPPV